MAAILPETSENKGARQMIPDNNTLWAMEPGKLHAMLDNARLRTDWPTQRQLEAFRRTAVKRLNKVQGKIAVLPLHGVVEQRPSAYSFFFGGASSDDLGRTIDALMANKEVQAVVLDVDSPGGSVPGTQELASKILGYRGNGKPIYAVSNSLMASAAYWICSGCEQIIASPGAETGSIGVIGFHFDETAMMEGLGIKVTTIRSGRYKGEGNSFEPLSSEAKDFLQGQWDATHGAFLGHVAKGRGKPPSEVRTRFGEGRTLLSEDALAVGMVDRIGTLDEVLAKLSGVAVQQQKRAEETPVEPVVEEPAEQPKRIDATILKLRHEQRKRKGA